MPENFSYLEDVRYEESCWVCADDDDRGVQ